MTNNVTFSIIIPSFNRKAQLATCVQGIKNQTLAASQFELIIVDDGSSDPISSSDLDISPVPRLLVQSNKGPAAARNYGASVARGTFLIFIDDDCTPDPNWLLAIHTQLSKTPDALLGGKTINRLRKNCFAATSQIILDSVYQHYNRDPEKAYFFSSNNMLVPKKLFRSIKGFDETMRTAEDRDLCDRLYLEKHRLVYAPRAIVYHAHDLTLATFFKQHFDYGRGAYTFHQKRRERGAGPFHIDLNFHLNLRNWLNHVIQKTHGDCIFRIIVLLLVWQIANTAGFIVKAARQVWPLK